MKKTIKFITNSYDEKLAIGDKIEYFDMDPEQTHPATITGFEWDNHFRCWFIYLRANAQDIGQEKDRTWSISQRVLRGWLGRGFRKIA